MLDRYKGRGTDNLHQVEMHEDRRDDHQTQAHASRIILRKLVFLLNDIRFFAFNDTRFFAFRERPSKKMSGWLSYETKQKPIS